MNRSMVRARHRYRHWGIPVPHMTDMPPMDGDRRATPSRATGWRGQVNMSHQEVKAMRKAPLVAQERGVQEQSLE